MQLEHITMTLLKHDTQATSEHSDPSNHFQTEEIVKEVETYFSSLSIFLLHIRKLRSRGRGYEVTFRELVSKPRIRKFSNSDLEFGLLNQFIHLDLCSNKGSSSEIRDTWISSNNVPQSEPSLTAWSTQTFLENPVNTSPMLFHNTLIKIQIECVRVMHNFREESMTPLVWLPTLG